MKHPSFFPFYNIYSDLVKTALGLKSARSVDRFFRDAGIKVYLIGKKKCVTCEDLFNATKPKPVIFRYEAQSELAKKFDELD